MQNNYADVDSLYLYVVFVAVATTVVIVAPCLNF